MDLERLKERARIIQLVRRFFIEKNFLEVDTPLLSPDLIPESCLEVFETKHIHPCGTITPYWLIPSPEIWMKKIIARHRVNIFQIGKCFRNGESTGFLHSPEFTMLEYYAMDAGYLDSLVLTEQLIDFLANNAVRNPILKSPFERITVKEAFERYAGFDLFAVADQEGGLEKEAMRLGLDVKAGTGKEILYDLIFIQAVEPQLQQLGPVALLDYPAFVPCLAKRNASGKTMQRWELYFKGIELANCFSEETDALAVKDFFGSEARKKEQHAHVLHNTDADYWKMFNGRENSFPQCSGVALGLDRLIMALCGVSTIDAVLPFTLYDQAKVV